MIEGVPVGPEWLAAPVARAAELARPWRRVLVASHVNPDGDALGSTLGVALALRAAGREVTAVSAGPMPFRPSRSGRPTGLGLLPGIETLVGWDAILGDRFDGAVVVDCAAYHRLHADPAVARQALARASEAVVLDHHDSAAEAESLGAADLIDGLRVVDPSRAAAAEITALFVEALGLEIGRDAATALLTGIFTDSGSFMYGTADGHTFAVAGRLRARGATNQIANDTLRIHDLDYLPLLGDVLSRLRVLAEGRALVATMPRELVRRNGASDGERSLVSSLLRATRGVYATALLVEDEDGVRGSIRTRAPVDAITLATAWGGGGHARASGFRVAGSRLVGLEDEVALALEQAVMGLDRID